jgi:hypothetical protein
MCLTIERNYELWNKFDSDIEDGIHLVCSRLVYQDPPQALNILVILSR